MSVVALLVFERLKRGGGVQEILILLDETRQGIADDVMGPGASSRRVPADAAPVLSATSGVHAAGGAVPGRRDQRLAGGAV